MARRRLTVVPIVLLVAASGQIHAQVDRTAITGVVIDEQWRRIPECVVRATETVTGFQRETVATFQGSYDLPGLPLGTYAVRFVKSGFAVFTANHVRQVVGQRRTLDARLELARGQEQTTWLS